MVDEECKDQRRCREDEEPARLRQHAEGGTRIQHVGDVEDMWHDGQTLTGQEVRADGVLRQLVGDEDQDK